MATAVTGAGTAPAAACIGRPASIQKSYLTVGDIFIEVFYIFKSTIFNP
jgi:hypothetical protein